MTVVIMAASLSCVPAPAVRIFVLPLIVIFMLVYLGKLTLETATDWQAQYSRRLHLAAGLLMLAAGVTVWLT